ncbi:uncharacterized protein PAC_17003 [Phialocephala subalpina]|uniref:Uncharacterized protein n=1 Tax=Phialocephala subalpina TaxID=576137 RepID=A0A1L7XPZ0_9HELO|nr:uncharacterized protein PAC_17003 [Phialocephala subalpina]
MTETHPRRATNDITGEPLPIRAATQVCRQRLQECASQASLREGHWAENRSSDFNLWDSGVGACANELNCLDKRLERDISAQKVVIGALSTLAAWTTKCRELAEAVEPTTGSPDHQPRSNSMSTNEHSTYPPDSITLDEAKNTVEGLLKILVDLEIAIRRAGTASRVRRADRTFNKRKDDYVELSEHLEFILRVSGAPRRNHTSANQRSAPAKTDEIDVESALDQLQGEKAPLRPEQRILLLANIKRTDRFQFYKGRQEQLRSEQAQKLSQGVRVQVRSSRAQTSNPPIKSEEQLGQSLQPLTNEHATSARSQHSTGTTNQVSDYVPGSSLEKAIEVTSPGVAVTTIALRADYPKPPKDKTKCPYCLIPFKGEADDMRQWKKHASEDLQPYTCYLPNCPQDHPFFNTFGAWKAHVLSKDHHQFEGWTCLFCRFSSKSTEESIFLDHIQNNHSNAVAKESLTNFANMCRQYTAPALDRCPVCSTYEIDWKLRKDSDPKFEPRVKSFLEHLGQCMHYFALRVLPETEPVKPGDGSGQNLTNVSPIEDRSWPSCYLHVSHRTDAGLTETDLEIFPELTPHNQVDNSQRMQTWVELAENMDDPNSLDEVMRLDPRYGMGKEEKLIERSEDEEIDSKDNNGWTLSYAAEMGHEAVVKLLLEKGTELETKDSSGQTPLLYAAKNGHEAVVKLLLEKGAELETKSAIRRTPLSYAAEKGHEAIVKLLLEKGVELETKSVIRRTPLSYAAEKGHEPVVKLLLEKGTELETKDSSGQTPLLYAAKNGHEAIVKLLLEKGAMLEAIDTFKRTPLLCAAEKGYEAIMKLLLEKGAKLEAIDDLKQTPLLYAAKKGHKAIVKLLLEKGAELEAKDNTGWTPLLWAIEKGHEAVVKLLLEKGAELEVKVSNGRTPLSWAANKGHEAIVKLLLEKGAKLEAKSISGATPLLYAADEGHEAVVKLLLEKGVELETKDEFRWTPLSYAAKNGHEAVVKLLLEKGAKKP